MSTDRLLTLIGSGGCGKTRLALETARGLLDDYSDGVWLVDLAPLGDPGLVAEVTASAIGVHEQPGQPMLHVLLAHLAERNLLLVLDNCEHLVDACARLVEKLLRACPGVRILATSREPLGVPGETTWRVPSLELPEESQSISLERLADCESVRLFLDRARQAQPGFSLTLQNAPALVEVCRRLDGIPLAIELAAGRLRTLGVEQIAERLDGRFGLLTSGSRVALPRHQPLKTAIDWSYDLLTPSERLLFQRLAVFAGSFALEAGESVCCGNGLQAQQILDLLAQLSDRSLVMVDGAGSGVARYRLLETLRQYGCDRLTEAGEVEAVRLRHRDWYLALAERAEPEMWGMEQRLWLDRLGVEHGNLRAALEWCLERDVESGLRLGVSLWQFWQVRSHLSEGRRWLEAMVARAPEPTVLLAWALLALGSLVPQHVDDYAEAAARIEASLAIFRQVGDERGIAFALLDLGWLLRFGNRSRARAHLEESLTLFRRIGDDLGIGRALTRLGGLVDRPAAREGATRGGSGLPPASEGLRRSTLHARAAGQNRPC